MKPISHVVASGVFGSAFYLLTQSSLASLVCFTSGIFIDLDHWLDYYLATGNKLVGPKALCLYCYELKFSNIYLLLHSYEITVLLWLVISAFKLNIYWIAIASGITQHMIFDQLGNTRMLNPLGYFLSYRINNNFKTDLIARKERAYARG